MFVSAADGLSRPVSHSLQLGDHFVGNGQRTRPTQSSVS